MKDCIFCKIVAGEAPARVVFEDELVVAFEDANPVAPVHVLIIPKEHIPTLNDLKEADGLLSHIGAVAREVAGKYGVADEGYRLFFNVNRGGGQVIFHLHAHLMAGRHLGDYLIGFAVGVSVVWRKIVRLFKGK
jgi:histidine triad (HIT) family protein